MMLLITKTNDTVPPNSTSEEDITGTHDRHGTLTTNLARLIRATEIWKIKVTSSRAKIQHTRHHNGFQVFRHPRHLREGLFAITSSVPSPDETQG